MSAADGRGHRAAGRAKRGGGGDDQARPAAAKSPAATVTTKKVAASNLASPSVKMTIASSYSDAREVQRLIREAIEQADYDPDSQFAIKLSLEEAIINAIKHGNKLDKDKHVHVEWSVTPEAAEIIIEDEGPGFSRTDVPDPTDDSNLQKLTGRGILLIETYMNTVEWSKGGRRVRLVRKNAGRGRGVKTA
jgi:serine/threonine-protein kinase RsbW